MSKLVQFNTAALKRIADVNTATLHDFSFPREEGATASEVGGCPRQIVLGLKFPEQHSGKTLRKFRRGHLFEEDQASRFEAMGFVEVDPENFETAKPPCFCRQLTLEHPHQPVGAHLDFVVKHRDHSLHVVECKTTNGIPTEPYGSWVSQLYLQMGLLAFRFPKTTIRGSILAADLNAGEEEEFNSYTHDTGVFDALVAIKCDHLIKAKKGEEEPACEPQLYCGKCRFRGDCPAFIGGSVAMTPEVTAIAARYQELTAAKKEIESELDALKKVIGEDISSSYKGIADGVMLDVSYCNGRKSIDEKKLSEKYPDVAADTEIYKRGKSYAKIEAKLVPPPVTTDEAPAKAA